MSNVPSTNTIAAPSGPASTARGIAAAVALTALCAPGLAQGSLTNYGSGTPGTAYTPKIRGIGEPQVGNTSFAVELYDAQPGAAGTLLLGTQTASVPVAGVTILNTAELSFGVVADASGTVAVPVPIPPDDVYHDLHLYAQFIVAEQPQNQLTATDGLDILMRGYSVPKPPPEEPSVPGVTYYVNSATGSNSYDGLTPTTAFLTVAKGVSMLDHTGGDRLVLDGTFAEQLNLQGINPTGNPDRPTVITAARDASGAFKTAQLDGGAPSTLSGWPYDRAGSSSPKDGLKVINSNHVFVSGISVRGFSDNGVVSYGSSNVTLSELDVRWVGRNAMWLTNTGFYETPVHDIVVAHCRIDNANLGRWLNYAVTGAEGFQMSSECLTLAQITDYEVYGVHLSNTFKEGICPKPNSSGTIHHNLVEYTRSVGIYVNESSDCEVTNNIVRGTGYFDDGTSVQTAVQVWNSTWPAGKGSPYPLDESGSTGILIATGDLGSFCSTGNITNVTVRENVVAYTRKNGLVTYNPPADPGSGCSSATMDHILIENNVVFGACQNTAISTAGLIADWTMTDSSVTNNIVVLSQKLGANISGNGTPMSGTLVIANNQFYGNQAGIGQCPSYNCAQSTWWGNGVIHADPLFVLSPGGPGSAGDFRLQAGSPAIDSGLSNGLLEVNGARDRGAYETGTYEWLAGQQ